MFPTDQIIFGRSLITFQRAYVHAAGLKIRDRGFLFLGHSGAGKSTIAKQLETQGEILCDDRIVVNGEGAEISIHGSWSHGTVSRVSSAGAPLAGLFFIEKAKHNSLVPITDKREVLKRLLPVIIRPLISSDWWIATLSLVSRIIRETPAFILSFDTSGKISETLKERFNC